MSGNLVILRRRIRTVHNTQKLTKAMKTVSAAKLKRSTSDLQKTRPFMEKLRTLLEEVGGMIHEPSDPLINQRESSRRVLVTVSSDKGLCGPFNSRVIEKAEEILKNSPTQKIERSIVTVGNKVFRHFSKAGVPISKNFPSMMSRLTAAGAAQLTAYLQQIYEEEEIGGIDLLVTEFVSSSRQQVNLVPLFPLNLPLPQYHKERDEIILEPDADSLFHLLLPRYVQARVYRLLLGSAASEQAARMLAMDLATRNASDMIRSLQLTLNKLRQASITKELLEIMTATEALKQ